MYWLNCHLVLSVQDTRNEYDDEGAIDIDIALTASDSVVGFAHPARKSQNEDAIRRDQSFHDAGIFKDDRPADEEIDRPRVDEKTSLCSPVCVLA